jgi:hypothetical protein
VQVQVQVQAAKRETSSVLKALEALEAKRGQWRLRVEPG